jgi:hypothetical protein
VNTQEELLAQLYSLVLSPGGGAPSAEVNVPVVSPETASTEGALGSRLNDQLALIVRDLDLLKTVQQSQGDLLGASSKAAVGTSTASNGASAAMDAAKGVLSGFAISPILSGLLKLFGGGPASTEAAAPVSRYAAPEPARLDAGLVGGERLTTVDRGAGDRVRVIEPERAAAAQPANVTVHVTAMDSRSFLDRSDEIARAVRLAMLESHAINDVVAEL